MLNRIRQTFAGVLSRRRQAKHDYTAYRALIGAPGNLTTGIRLPASVQLYVATNIITNSPGPVNVLLVNNTRQLFMKQGANVKQDVGRFSSGMVVKKATAGSPGAVKIYIMDRVGVFHLIGQ